jgi:hypothetical protein
MTLRGPLEILRELMSSTPESVVNQSANEKRELLHRSLEGRASISHTHGRERNGKNERFLRDLCSSSNPQSEKNERNSKKQKTSGKFPTGSSRLCTPCFSSHHAPNNNQIRKFHTHIRTIPSARFSLMQHHSEVFFRGARATLLVHDVGTCDHDLHGDDDGEVHAHLGSGGGDD